MTGEQFVTRVQQRAYESVVQGTLSLLQEPPGRRPAPSLVELSQWFNQLCVDDREHARRVVELAVRNAVFQMLAILDGVAPIREADEDVGTLELRYITQHESSLLTAPVGEFLHDIFASLIPLS